MRVKKHYRKLITSLLLIFLLLANQSITAQFSTAEQKTIDSLDAILKNEGSHDTSLATAYVLLSEILYVSNLDTIVPLCTKASEIAERGLSTHPSTQIAMKFREALGRSLNSMGFFYDSQGDIPQALEYYHKGLTLRKGIGNKAGMANSYYKIGSLLFKQGAVFTAKQLGKKGLKLAQELGYPKYILLNAQLLSSVAIHERNYKEALSMRNLEILILDSINNKDAIKAIASQQARYESQKKAATDSVLVAEANKVTKAQLAAQGKQLEQDKTVKRVLYGGILTLLLFGGIMCNRYRTTTKQKRVIEQQKKVVEKHNKNRERMMQEIHHRVKNNMQVVQSLLGLHANKIDDEAIVAMFHECQNRITTMAIIHENMCQSDELSKIDTGVYIQSLVEQIAFSYKLGGKIDLKLDIPSVKFSSKTLVPLGLIINEIITNAFKYAFSDQEPGEISLEVQEINDNEYQMIIGDNGVGMPLDFKHQESNSLGTELVHIFTEQLDGTIERVKQAGTVFKITFIPQEG